MARLSILLTFCVFAGMAQYSHPDQRNSVTDSLVDVFPLSIGNQWTYGYYYHFEDPGGAMWHWCDTGTVHLQITEKTVTLDSTRWLVQETKRLWWHYNDIWSGPHEQTDTFEIIEFNYGHHRIYRTGDPVEVRSSVLPFLSSFLDTVGIRRFAAVDSGGMRTIFVHGAPTFSFTFRQGTGLSSVSMSDGCTCIPWYGSDHSLRSSVISGVTPPPGGARPQRYCLSQNFPNPFNPSTTISFNLPSRSFVSLIVFDLLGKKVATIVSEEMQAGNHARQWDASGLASGVYWYRLSVVPMARRDLVPTNGRDGQTGSFTETRKLVVLK